jgi:anti-sigma-K factor RskA
MPNRVRWKRPSINGNSAVARRIRKQADLYRSLLGNPSDALTQRRIAEAAELAVAVEDWRAKLVNNSEDVAAAETLVRLSNIHARIEAKLNLPDVGARPKPKTLEQHLAERAAAAAGASSEAPP